MMRDEQKDEQERAASKEVAGQGDTSSSMRLILAQQLQEAIAAKINKAAKDGLDYGTIIQCLGLMTATFAACVGISKGDLQSSMTVYFDQIYSAIGGKETKDQSPASSNIIIPS